MKSYLSEEMIIKANANLHFLVHSLHSGQVISLDYLGNQTKPQSTFLFTEVNLRLEQPTTTKIQYAKVYVQTQV